MSLSLIAIRVYFLFAAQSGFVKSLPQKIIFFLALILAAVFLISLTFFLYQPCHHGSFIWDDNFLVKENLLIRSPRLFFEAFRHFLGYDPASNFYRPVQTLSYMLDYWRGGLSPSIYHQTNNIIHGLNGLLLFAFLFSISQRESLLVNKRIIAASFAISLLWLVHPIHSATVAYIAGRADSLALFFILIVWYCWEKMRSSEGVKQYTLGSVALIAGLFALCSKEAALSGMAFFLLNALFLEKNISKKQKLLVFVGCAFLVCFYLILRLSINNLAEANSFFTQISDRPHLILRALGDYLRLLFYPVNLRMERQVTMVPNLYSDPSGFDPIYPFLAFLGGIFLFILAIGFFRKGPYQNLRRFGALWFVVMLLPVSNVLSLNSTVAEHWLYIPAIGLMILLFGWWLEMRRQAQNAALVFVFIWVIGLSLRTFVRSSDWSTPITFFNKTIQDGGDSARMRVNLANEYRRVGRSTEAEALLQLVVKESPAYNPARHALASNLMLQGKNKEANQLLGESETALGKTFSGQVYTVNLMLKRGELESAGKLLRKLTESYPDSWLVTKETLLFYDIIHQPEKKLATLESFTQRNGWHSPSQMALGDLFTKEGRANEAAQYYRKAAELDVRSISPSGDNTLPIIFGSDALE